MENEFLNVVEHAAAFFNGIKNRSEVVVCEHNVGSVFGYIRTCTHANTNVGAFEGGRIVNTVTSLIIVSILHIDIDWKTLTIAAKHFLR